LKLLGQNFQQRRLTVSISAHDANSIALVDSNSDAIENLLGWKFELNLLSTQ
jgi:hypothetical protein